MGSVVTVNIRSMLSVAYIFNSVHLRVIMVHIWSRWCYGQDAFLDCGSRPSLESGQNKDYEICMCGFSAKYRPINHLDEMMMISVL